jgi:hypothetical protein
MLTHYLEPCADTPGSDPNDGVGASPGGAATPLYHTCAASPESTCGPMPGPARRAAPWLAPESAADVCCYSWPSSAAGVRGCPLFSTTSKCLMPTDRICIARRWSFPTFTSRRLTGAISVTPRGRRVPCSAHLWPSQALLGGGASADLQPFRCIAAQLRRRPGPMGVGLREFQDRTQMS